MGPEVEAILETVRQWQVIAAVRSNIALIRDYNRPGAPQWEIEAGDKVLKAWAQRFDDLRGYVCSHAPELLPLLPPVYIYDLANCDAQVVTDNMLRVQAGLLAKAAPGKPADKGMGQSTIPLLVTITKSRLRVALGNISESTLANWIKDGEIKLHGEHKKAAKKVILDANRFAEPVRTKVLKAAGVDTLADATQ